MFVLQTLAGKKQHISLACMVAFSNNDYKDFEMPLESSSGKDSNLDDDVLPSHGEVILPAHYTSFCNL